MAKYHLTIRASKKGSSTQFPLEIDVPDQVAKFLGNSNYRDEANDWVEHYIPLDKKKIYDVFEIIGSYKMK